MSDSDDWENALDDAIETGGKEESKVAEKFKDEDAYDSEEERRKKKATEAEEEAKKKAAEAAKQPKQKTKDYDAMFDARKKKNAQKTTDAILASGLKGEDASRAAEEDITEALFATEVNTDAGSLKTEKDYVKFAKSVSGVLYEGKGGYNLPAFFKELLRDIGKSTITTTEDLKTIVDTVTVVYNNKVAEDKKKDQGSKKKKDNKAKPMIATGKNTYERNNNPGMVNDLMGDEDQYAYGEEGYGDETEYKGKEPEGEHDFM